MTSDPWKQGVDNKTNLKTDDSWESNFYQVLSPCKNKYTFDLNLVRYRGQRSKLQNPPFCLHLLADMSSVEFVYILVFCQKEIFWGKRQ